MIQTNQKPVACSNCPGALLASALPFSMRYRKARFASLVALFVPGVLFGSGLMLLRHNSKFSWINDLSEYPWEVWILVVCGAIATLGGVADWVFHRWATKCVIGRKERNCELLALACGGIPMFILMAAASIVDRPQLLLLPILVVLLFTVVIICYDEFIFHRRRCKGLEILFHRLLVFGNGIAWLAWVHWCFVRV